MDATNEHRQREPRTLVLCFDGTSNKFDGDNTNVVKLFSLLRKDDPHRQLVYYQPGIGTFAKPGVLTPALLWLARIVDMAVAWYLDEHVLGGYTFLMQNYEPGDKIVMFGFSRGAYTVRALAGMLHKVGLLPRDNLHHAPFAYKMYRRNDETGFKQSAAFKQHFSCAREVQIEFMGLWDTVSSVGVIKPRRLPFTSSNTTVRVFRHAVALDERRSRFRPTLWSQTHLPSADAPQQTTPTRIANSLRRTFQRRSTVSAPSTVPNSPLAPPHLQVIPETGSQIGSEVPLPSIGTGGRSPLPPAHAPLPDLGSPEHPLPLPRIDSLPTETASAPAVLVDAPAVPPAQPRLGALRSWIKLPRLRLPRRHPSHAVIERELHLEREFDERDAQAADRWRAHAGSPTSPRFGRHRTDVSEVWFAGSHSDVGGGNVADEAPHMLSNLSLHWMIREAIRTQSDVQWDHGAFSQVGLPLNAFGLARHGSERDGGRRRHDTAISGFGLGFDQHHASPTTPRVEATRLSRPTSPFPNDSGGGPNSPAALAPIVVSRPVTPMPEEGAGDDALTTQSRAATPVPAPHPDSPILEVANVPRVHHAPPPSVLPLPFPRPESRTSGVFRHERDTTAFAIPRAPTTSTLQLNAFGRDAEAPLRDELAVRDSLIAPVWWLLELVPAIYWYQAASGKWRRTTRPNLGRPRRLPDGVRVHESVKQRMVASNYLPCSWREGLEPEWVF